MPLFSIFATLPKERLNHQSLIQVMGDNSSCTDGMLMEIFTGGTPTETLAKIKYIRDNLISRGYVTLDSFEEKYTLTDKGWKVHSLLVKQES